MDIGKVASTGRWWMFAAIAAASFAVPAEAQQTLISSPDSIRACLCQERAVNREASVLAARRQTYEEQKRQANALVAQAASQKSQVNINDPSAIAAYSELLGQRDAAVRNLADDLTPRYSAFVASYNRHVAEYNQQCTGQSFDAAVMNQVRQNLVCPTE
jgi:recombinational DNA repair ATPase RecF